MSESETVYSSKVKYNGVCKFADFYKFCYEWLSDEKGLSVSETAYNEKISGTSKDIEIEWIGKKKVTDYFKFKVKINFRILGLSEVEVVEGGAKVKTNKGSFEISAKGDLIRDYDGKFEHSAFQKFLRGIYEKWVIASRVEEYEDKLIGVCDSFLGQAKAYLDLEGKR